MLSMVMASTTTRVTTRSESLDVSPEMRHLEDDHGGGLIQHMASPRSSPRYGRLHVVVYVLLLLCSICTTVLTSIESSWWMLSIGVLVVDSMVDLSIHQTGVIYVSTQVFTTSGHGAMLANTPFHGMLVIGIAVAMHGVATYAHIYVSV